MGPSAPDRLVKPNNPDAKIKFPAADALREVGGAAFGVHGDRFAEELGRRDHVTLMNRAAGDETITQDLARATRVQLYAHSCLPVLMTTYMAEGQHICATHVSPLAIIPRCSSCLVIVGGAMFLVILLTTRSKFARCSSLDRTVDTPVVQRRQGPTEQLVRPFFGLDETVDVASARVHAARTLGKYDL